MWSPNLEEETEKEVCERENMLYIGEQIHEKLKYRGKNKHIWNKYSE